MGTFYFPEPRLRGFYLYLEFLFVTINDTLKNIPMKGYFANIEQESVVNENFRKVVYTGKNTQLVVMSLLPNEDIGEEVHEVDQFLRIEQGRGKAVLDG